MLIFCTHNILLYYFVYSLQLSALTRILNTHDIPIPLIFCLQFTKSCSTHDIPILLMFCLQFTKSGKTHNILIHLVFCLICSLQLSAMTRILNTHDIPILLVQLVETPPWSHKKNGTCTTKLSQISLSILS